MSRWLVPLLVLAALTALLYFRTADPTPPRPQVSAGEVGAATTREHGSIADATTTAAAAEASAGRREAADVAVELRGRVVDDAAQPLADVPVHVAADPALSPQAMLRLAQRGRFLTALASAATDRDGRFRLLLPDAIPGEHLQVHALPPDHGAASLRRIVAARGVHDLPDLVAPHERPVRILVIDDATEAPIAGARVSARADGLSLLRLPGCEHGRTATTDAGGAAELPGLAVGSYTFRAEAEGFAAQELPRQAVQAEEATEVLLALSPGLSIAGHVADQAGRPLDRAFVEAIPLAGDVVARVAATSDELGRFELVGVRDGSYLLQVGRVGYGTLRLQPIAAGSTQLVCTLVPQGVIRLLVFDRDGAPVTTCTATARPTGPAAGLRERPPLTFTAADLDDGAFVLDDLDAGTWTVRVEAPGRAPATSEPVVVATGSSASCRVVVDAGATLRLLLSSAGGAPVVGARVTLQPDGFADGPAAEVLAPLLGSATAAARRTESTAAGRVVLPHVEPGSHQLRIEVAERAPHYVRGITVTGADIDLGIIELPPVQTLLGSALVAGAVDRSVVVQVLALPGGILPAGYRLEATVDAEGRWRCAARLPAGRYAVQAGRRLAADPFLENQDGAASRVEITLDDGDGDSGGERRVDLQLGR